MKTIIDQFRSGAFLDTKTPIGAVTVGLLFLIAAWLAGRALRLTVHRLLAQEKHTYVDRMTVNFFAQFAKIAVYLFAFISYAHLVPALARLGTAWLAGVSIISVVVGLAAQSTLGNLIAGVSLLLYRPFKIGDRLQVTTPVGVQAGVVETVNLGYTVLRTDDNHRVVVPNSVMASQTMINLG